MASGTLSFMASYMPRRPPFDHILLRLAQKKLFKTFKKCSPYNSTWLIYNYWWPSHWVKRLKPAPLRTWPDLPAYTILLIKSSKTDIQFLLDTSIVLHTIFKGGFSIFDEKDLVSRHIFTIEIKNVRDPGKVMIIILQIWHQDRWIFVKICCWFNSQ